MSCEENFPSHNPTHKMRGCNGIPQVLQGACFAMSGAFRWKETAAWNNLLVPRRIAVGLFGARDSISVNFSRGNDVLCFRRMIRVRGQFSEQSLTADRRSVLILKAVGQESLVRDIESEFTLGPGPAHLKGIFARE
jgi:hypothetical protein